MVRKTKQDALATRNLILDTAECVFQRRGVAATSLQEIAQAAGLTRGAIYWHFQNKADVFAAMMERVVLPLEHALEASDALERSDPLGVLCRGVDDLLAKLVHDPQVRRVFEIATLKVEYAGDLQVLRERRVRSRDACMADLERLFTLAAVQGQIDATLPPAVAARGLCALVDGLMLNWLLDPQAFDLQSTGSQMLDTYLRGLTGRNVQPPAPVRIKEVATEH
ncbi:MAG TPA: TetR family transcriptional regulator [Burkholderiaceae bacterium]|nr:TetR family transcriptional regulator [Burkholderiaceae bacterium]HQZ06095.1 TetR family transcriptional regulator [Burkholderiaceae bacterium]